MYRVFHVGEMQQITRIMKFPGTLFIKYLESRVTNDYYREPYYWFREIGSKEKADITSKVIERFIKKLNKK